MAAVHWEQPRRFGNARNGQIIIVGDANRVVDRERRAASAG